MIHGMWEDGGESMTGQDERSVANTWETVAGRPRAVVAWMCEGPCRLMSFNTPSPAGGTIGEIIELLGGGDWLEEVDPWGWVSSSYNPTLHPVHFLLPGCECNVTNSLSRLMSRFSYHRGLEAQRSPSLWKPFLAGYLITTS